ncbi:hypothetical protein SteCoe_8107 [Stentor coeruleus]|uniref:PWWP domain-containing protein n=1 Tax=Stentor coeruleus TaxID=5963 RepID=A0A1R2CL36_9CILI|nr:hypothetical protein SteCoe_8107 [Stentor coeruleus]
MKVNQVVWGKVPRFPWWPGIIREIKQNTYKVDFIGDPITEILQEHQINSFSEGMKEFSKATTKALKISIEYAKKIGPNGIDKSSLDKMNQEILEKLKAKKPRENGAINPPKSYAKSLKSLENLLKTQLKTSFTQDTPLQISNFFSLLPILQSLEPTFDSKCSFQTIFDAFYSLFQHFPNLDENSMRSIKYFSQTFEKTPIKAFEKLSSKVYDFYLFWKLKKIKKEIENKKKASSIVNARLRKHVCRKLALALQGKNIEKRDSQVKALNFERQIREDCPDMGADYIKKCKLLLKAIKIDEDFKYI